MPPWNFAAELARWSPHADFAAPSRKAAEAYCRNLARTHYENFSVASWLVPRALRQHFYNVYAYCRWADDLADETSGGQESLALLDWWERELDAMYAGQVRHPVFVALQKTVEEFGIPRTPFANLLIAFRRDQTQTRYETFADLLDYCRYSANPVGELVLYLGRSHSDENVQRSNQVCTGLQLANFWQDIRRDWERGRIYLPQEVCRHFDYTEQSPGWGTATPPFKRMMALQVQQTEKLLLEGRSLVDHVCPALRWQVDLFVRGGLAILDAIRRQDYGVWSKRPVVSRWTKLSLVAQTWWKARVA